MWERSSSWRKGSMNAPSIIVWIWLWDRLRILRKGNLARTNVPKTCRLVELRSRLFRFDTDTLSSKNNMDYILYLENRLITHVCHPGCGPISPHKGKYSLPEDSIDHGQKKKHEDKDCKDLIYLGYQQYIIYKENTSMTIHVKYCWNKHETYFF